MCFVAGWFEGGSESSLTIAANRDEFYDRQGEKPELHRDGTFDVLSPRDPRKDGTWIGVNEEGLFVALTNILDSSVIENAPSRGQLVRTLLEEAPDRSTALEHYESLDPSRFNPFWLMVADPSGVSAIHHEAEGDERNETSDGAFLLTNRSGFQQGTDVVRSALPELDHPDSGDTFDELETFCRSHDPLLERDGHCLHAEIAGTLSSSILRIEPENHLEYRFAQGPPCETDYESVDVPDDFADGVLTTWGSKTAPVRDN